MPAGERQTLRFGPFELDPSCGELRRDGVRIKLQGQPIQVLGILLEKSGQLVSREEIRQRIWAADTFVDFDHNLNTAVKRLRQALGDEAETPRYIETVPKHGYRFIGEVDNRETPETIAAAPAESAPASDAGTPPKAEAVGSKRSIIGIFLLGIAAGILLGGLFAAAWYSRLHEASPRAPVRSQLSFRHPPAMAMDTAIDFALSPDGRYFVYASDSPTPQLWLKNLQQNSEEPLSGTDFADAPFWSPDGRYIGFFAGGKLKKIALGSRVVNVLCEQRIGTSAWGKSGIILVSTPRGIQSVSAEGGAKHDLSQHGLATLDMRPSFLPDGEHYLFMRVPTTRYLPRKESGILYVGALDERQPRSLGLSVTGRAIYASGYLLYPTQHGLFAQPFDARRTRLSGEPTLLFPSEGLDIAFAVSENGVLVSRSELTFLAEKSEIRLYSRSGVPEKEPIAQGLLNGAQFSPDGTRLAYSQTTGEDTDIWIHDLKRHTNLRLTPGDSFYGSPVWSPDSQRVAYSYAGTHSRGVAARNADGTGKPEVLFETSREDLLHYWPSSWSAKDDCLFMNVTEINGPRKIQVLCLSGDRKLRPLPDPRSTSRAAPIISPNGRWLAYMLWEPQPKPHWSEIFVEPYPGPGESLQVSFDDGFYPAWRSDGRELYFLSKKRTVEAVPVSYAGNTIKLGKPTELFSLSQSAIQVMGIPFGASPDGKHFAINRSLVKPDDTMKVLTNWDAAVKK